MYMDSKKEPKYNFNFKKEYMRTHDLKSNMN